MPAKINSVDYTIKRINKGLKQARAWLNFALYYTIKRINKGLKLRLITPAKSKKLYHKKN